MTVAVPLLDAAGGAVTASRVGAVAPLLAPGPLRDVAQGVSNPVRTGIGKAVDVGHKAAAGAGKETTRLLGPSPVSAGSLGSSRLVAAAVAGFIMLEILAWATGTPFSWTAGASKAKTTAQYIGLYPGQAQKLAALQAQAATPATAAYPSAPPTVRVA